MYSVINVLARVVRFLGCSALLIGQVSAAPGDLDPSFGSDGSGKVVTAIGTSHDKGNAVAIDTNGKIVVSGSAVVSGTDFALARYNPNGTLDTTFNPTGTVTIPGTVSTNFSGNANYANAVAIGPGNRIFAAGAVD